MSRSRWPKGVGSYEERFWQRVEKGDGCWLWMAGLRPTGYGTFSPKHDVVLLPHRVAYELTKGPIPQGLYVMHSCDNRRCVRPDHLSVGTAKDNIADMIAKGRARFVVWTHCKRGHELRAGRRPRQGCSICKNAGARARRRMRAA